MIDLERDDAPRPAAADQSVDRPAGVVSFRLIVDRTEVSADEDPLPWGELDGGFSWGPLDAA